MCLAILDAGAGHVLANDQVVFPVVAHDFAIRNVRGVPIDEPHASNRGLCPPVGGILHIHLREGKHLWRLLRGVDPRVDRLGTNRPVSTV